MPLRTALLRRCDLELLDSLHGQLSIAELAALWKRAAELLQENPDFRVGTGPSATLSREESLIAAQKADELAKQPETH